MNPFEPVGIGRLQELINAGRGAGGQAQVRENLYDHCGTFNGGNAGHGAAAVRTGRSANTCLSNCA